MLEQELRVNVVEDVIDARTAVKLLGIHRLL